MFVVVCMNFIATFKRNANFEVNFYKRFIIFSKKFGYIKLKVYFCSKFSVQFKKTKKMATKIQQILESFHEIPFYSVSGFQVKDWIREVSMLISFLEKRKSNEVSFYFAGADFCC